jgi:hypothetical protein
MRPTLAPTDLLNFESWWPTLPAYSRQAAESNASSPQARALDFMQLDTAIPTTYLRFNQRYALVVLFFATSGSAWVNSRKWINSTECEWFAFGRMTCGPGGRVSQLNLTHSNMAGSIPTELSLLADLQSLEISDLTGLLSVEMPGR